MSQPRHPDVSVALSDQRDRPVAAVALVRRALQKAGYADDAERFTARALAGDADDFLELAAAFVVVR